MMLQKKTDLGTLMTRYKPDDDYPGFWIDLRTKDKELVSICNVEYNPIKKCIQIVVYGNVVSEEPTNIIEVPIKGGK